MHCFLEHPQVKRDAPSSQSSLPCPELCTEAPLAAPRYCAGTMPWGHPGEHQDFEPQRHDDGYLEVIGFTMTSLVRGLCVCVCVSPVPTPPLQRTTVVPDPQS